MEKVKKYIWWLVVAVICAVAFYFRLDAVNTVQYEMSYDAINYHNMANNFIDTGILGYSTSGRATESNAYITPGYPLFLSAVYSIFGKTEAGDIYAVRLAQAVLSTVTVLFVFLIGKKIGNNFVGLIAAICMVIYPTFLTVAAFHLTETLYIFMFVMYLYIQLIAFDKNKRWIHCITGLIFGLAVIVRPAIFPLFIVVYLYKWIFERDKSAIKGLLFFILGLLVIMFPWWIRNLVLFNEFIILCTQTGNPLIAGAYPPEFAPTSYPPIEEQFEAAINAIITGFVKHPKEYFRWFTIDKFKLIFEKMYLIGYMPHLKFMENVHAICVYVGLAGALFGLFKKNASVIALYTIMTIGVQLLFIPENRYALPIMPMLMILSAYLVVEVLRFFGGKLKWIKC